MKRPILIALAAVLILLPAAGYAATLLETPVVPEACEQYLNEAAAEMNLSPEEARNLLEQARELRMRMRAKRLGITLEELQERMAERFQNRLEGQRRPRFRGNGPCH